MIAAGAPGIASVSYHLPAHVVESAELAARLGFEPAFLDQKVGIQRRHVCEPDVSTTDLCVKAAQRLLDESGTDPLAIDALIVVTQTPDACLPHTAARVQARLGLATRVASFDVGLGCSGFVYGLAIAEALMVASGFERLILVTADRYSSIMHPDDRSTQPLFSDAAAATLLLREGPRYVPGKGTFGTDGKLADVIAMRRSAETPHAAPNLYMDGRSVYSFMMNTVPGDLQRCLAGNGLRQDDVDLWVLHQASGFMLRKLSEHLSLPLERVVLDAPAVGNTVSSSIPIALARHVLPLPARPPVLMISGFGVGASWASNVLRHTAGDSEG